MQESRIDDHWNIDGSRGLSDSWTGFTQVTLLKEKPPDGYMWSGERLTKRQATSRPDHLWPEIWRSMSRNSKIKEEKFGQLKNPSWRTPEAFEVFTSLNLTMRKIQEIIKNARKMLEVPAAPAMPCRKTKKGTKNRETCSIKDDHKSKLTCILEADESKRLRMEGITPRIHEDHIAGKGNNSLQHDNLVHKFIPIPQAMKKPEAKAAVDKQWEKVEKFSAWNLA